MTSTLCQSAALERIIGPRTAKIGVLFYIIVETILTIAEIVRTATHEAMGRHVRMLRRGAGFLPPSASALYAAIGAAPARITDNCKVDLHVSLFAEVHGAWQAMSPQALLDRSREEQLEASG